MDRMVILDTETTGISPTQGHRIIEIGAIEMVNRRFTGQKFHVYLNPECDVSPGAVQVHGLTNAFLADKARFVEIAAEFKAFIEQAELIIHNAPFDVRFIKHEFKLLNDTWSIETGCTITDTLAMARRKYPGQKNNLDALCKRLNINNAHRQYHGALLDSEILAEVYLAMTGGQNPLWADPTQSSPQVAVAPASAIPSQLPPVLMADTDELAAHQAYLVRIAEHAETGCLWSKATES